MINKLIILCLSFIVVSCSRNVVSFSGEIAKPNSDYLKLSDFQKTYNHIIPVTKGGEFSTRLKLKDGFYTLDDGKESTRMYLKKGYKLFMKLNTEQFDESISYKGKGAEQNNHIAKYYLEKEAFMKYMYKPSLNQDFEEKIKGFSKKFNVRLAKQSDSIFVKRQKENHKKDIVIVKRLHNYKIFREKPLPKVKTESNIKFLEKERKELTPDFEYFLSDCLVNIDYNNCVDDLVSKAKNEKQKYLIAGTLYNISPKSSYKLHKSAYEKYPNELRFNLEYAIESHRIGDYKTAIKHYEFYKQKKDTDYRVDAWLSECYLNLGNYSKAIEHWKQANHPKNHTGIDKAIHIIHGKVDQIKKRSDLIVKTKSKDSKSAFELIFLDMNWESDWWNNNIQEYFLKKDINTIKNTFGSDSKEYLQLSAYNKVKHFSKKPNSKDSIKNTLLNSKLLLDNNQMPINGKIASDLLRISFRNKLLDEKKFFEERGQEIIELADKYKDEELLNIYAYLEAVTIGHVSEQTDKKGWYEYQSEKFAISYFIGLREKNKYDNPDLKKALIDFPNSSKIHWVKLKCAKIEGKDIKTDLIEVLKKEFKTLGFDQNKNSNGLNYYFHLLEKKI